jgi:hypothetical protein
MGYSFGEGFVSREWYGNVSGSAPKCEEIQHHKLTPSLMVDYTMAWGKMVIIKSLTS